MWPWRLDGITHEQHLSSYTWLRVQFQNWQLCRVNTKFIESENKYYRLGIADSYDLMIFQKLSEISDWMLKATSLWKESGKAMCLDWSGWELEKYTKFVG